MTSFVRSGLVVLAAFGAGVLPAAHLAAQPVCRTYSIDQVARSSDSRGYTGTVQQKCSTYSLSTNTVTCRADYNNSTGVGLSQVIVGSFRSLSEFIDEVRFQPPIIRLIKQDVNANGSPQQSLVLTYDAERRPLRSVLTSANGQETSVFSKWDQAGRYTDVLISSPGSPQQHVLYRYDEKARTMTIENPSLASTSVYTYDADGNLVLTVVTNQSGKHTIAVTIRATDRVCKPS